MDDSRSGTFLVWISPDSTRQVLTRLWPYSANALTVAPDGTVWTVGSVGNDAHVRIAFNVLRHYTPSGQLLTSTVVSGLRKRWDGEVDVTSNTRLMASNDRIGWLTDACQYVEFSFESVQLGSYTCPNGYDRQHMVDGGVALSSANDLLILPTGGRPLGPLAPLELDRAANTWKTVPVTLDSAEPQLILGFDGLTLVTSGYSKSASSLSIRRYAWSERVPASQ